MKPSASELAYRSAAMDGASHIGLLVVVYDALVLDLNRAAEASARNDISSRCRLSNHALQLLGHLESWLPYIDDPPLTSSLGTFYTFLRAEILRLQRIENPAGFTALALLIGETRAVWQRKEQQAFFAPAPSPSQASSILDVEIRTTVANRVAWSA